jgi:hypothetical protein
LCPEFRYWGNVQDDSTQAHLQTSPSMGTYQLFEDDVILLPSQSLLLVGCKDQNRYADAFDHRLPLRRQREDPEPLPPDCPSFCQKFLYYIRLPHQKSSQQARMFPSGPNRLAQWSRVRLPLQRTRGNNNPLGRPRDRNTDIHTHLGIDPRVT